MTPFGHRLTTELENEYRRMDSEWFFPWHGLNCGREVIVDNFDGSKIHKAGVEFWGSTELIYWEALRRYTLNKINEIFERAEREIRDTSPNHAASIASDCSNLLRSFCQRIVFHAIDTDRRLKGKGFPDKNYTSPNFVKITFADEIEQRKIALITFYSNNENSLGRKLEKLIDKNKGKLQIGGLLIAFFSLIIGALKFFLF